MTKERQFAPSLDLLNELFEIKNGWLTNKIARNSRTKIGSLAGSYSGRYALVFVQGIPWQVSRITFFLVNGWMPKVIDHVDGNTHNNHIDNLRAATHSQNSCNIAKSKKNRSGVKGVSWSSKHSKWYASIKINYKTKNLGYYDNLEDAKEFVELARDMVHGEFANHK